MSAAGHLVEVFEGKIWFVKHVQENSQKMAKQTKMKAEKEKIFDALTKLYMYSIIRV